MDNGKTYVGIVLYLDEGGDNFSYPNMSRDAARRREVYYRNLAACFASLYRHNRQTGDIKYLLFTNGRPADAGVERLLAGVGVETVSLEYASKPPAGYCSTWQGTFYYIDALEYLAGLMKAEDAAILLDPDCICLSPIGPVVAAVKKDGAMNYQIDYGADYAVNGFTRSELKKIIFEEDGLMPAFLPNYYGGEIYGFSGHNIKGLHLEVKGAWELSLRRFGRGLSKFNTEEHLFSYALWKTGLGRGNANRYIKRIWTSPFYRNVERTDTRLLIWHLPYEKERAMLRLAKDAEDKDSRFWTTDEGGFRRYVGGYIGVPHRTFSRYVKDGVYGVVKRVLKQAGAAAPVKT